MINNKVKEVIGNALCRETGVAMKVEILKGQHKTTQELVIIKE